MKAIQARVCGGPEVLVYEHAPRPHPGEGHVLIRVHAAGVNPADWQVLSRRSFKRQFPWTPGFDVSGVIVESGRRASGFDVGDAVYGMELIETFLLKSESCLCIMGVCPIAFQ